MWKSKLKLSEIAKHTYRSVGKNENENKFKNKNKNKHNDKDKDKDKVKDKDKDKENKKMPADALFSSLEQFHGMRPYGRFLDAGTGLHSLKWIQGLQTSSWTAITADNKMRDQLINNPAVNTSMRMSDALIVGNWMDDNFCSQLGTFDTILADYLIGAVEGFSPYEQDTIIARLKNHLNPNGRLYFVGMNPIPDEIALPTKIVSEVRQARDACILLAGHRCYREFPLSWMIRHIDQSGMTVVGSKKFTIMHSETSVIRQLKVAQSKLSLLQNNPLRNGMDKYLLDLEARVKEVMKINGSKIALSFDYVMAVEHKSTDQGEKIMPPAPPSKESGMNE